MLHPFLFRYCSVSPAGEQKVALVDGPRIFGPIGDYSSFLWKANGQRTTYCHFAGAGRSRTDDPPDFITTRHRKSNLGRPLVGGEETPICCA